MLDLLYCMHNCPCFTLHKHWHAQYANRMKMLRKTSEVENSIEQTRCMRGLLNCRPMSQM